MDREEYKAKQLELKEKYPNVFKIFWEGKDFPNDKSRHWGCQVWGLECASGWLGIIEDCARQIEECTFHYSRDEKEGVFAVQIKEKFGGLRFYMNEYNRDISEIISEAESRSFKTCEMCGKPGKLRSGSWLKTLCDKCNDEF